MEKTLTQKVENEVISKPISNKALGWFLAGAVALGALGYGVYKVYDEIKGPYSSIPTSIEKPLSNLMKN